MNIDWQGLFFQIKGFEAIAPYVVFGIGFAFWLVLKTARFVLNLTKRNKENED